MLSDFAKVYDNLRSWGAPEPEVRRKVDAANAMVQDTFEIMEDILVFKDRPYVSQERRELLGRMLEKSYAQSVFSSSISTLFGKSRSSSKSEIITAERAKAQAELAAKEAEVRMQVAVDAQRKVLDEFEREKTKQLRDMENQQELAKMRARIQAYAEAEHGGRVKMVEAIGIPIMHLAAAIVSTKCIHPR